MIIAPPKDLSGKQFCRRQDEPQCYVTVIRICKAPNGFQVLFRYGDDGHTVFCGYKKFLKNYPHEVTNDTN